MGINELKKRIKSGVKMFTKEMIEQDLRRLVDKYNETTNKLQKRYIKIGIRHNRNLLKDFEKRDITEIPMFEMFYLLGTKYRYMQRKLYELERKRFAGKEEWI